MYGILLSSTNYQLTNTPVKEGKNEWVKTKCICVSTIFISGINCKHICLHDPAIN